VYLPEDMPVCNSAIVNSSSSKAAGELASALLDVSDRTGAETLTAAKPAAPAIPLRTKVLRFM
jgi:hypothetical protein